MMHVMQYKVFKRILLDLHVSAPRSKASSIEAKIKDFRKRGVPATTPGKGRKAELSLADLAQTHFALRLNAYGVPPSLITEIVKDFYEDDLWPILKRATKDDTWIALRRHEGSPEKWVMIVNSFKYIQRILARSQVSLPTIVLNASLLVREVSAPLATLSRPTRGSSES